jgi:hypothetical protein
MAGRAGGALGSLRTATAQLGIGGAELESLGVAFGAGNAALADVDLEDLAASAEWPEHVAEMQERAGLRDADAELALRYLVAIAESPNAKRP